MKEYTLIEATREDLEKLYSTSGFTFEGLLCEKECLDDLTKFLDEFIKPEVEVLKIYRITGKLMNEYCDLVKDPYPDKLSIVTIPLDQLCNIPKLAIVKINVGARWFDDVIDNNKQRG